MSPITSLQIFRSHILRFPDGTLDVSGLVSKACYAEWLLAKPARPSDDEARKYHRTLTNHVSGVDGRAPFEPDEEEAILELLRRHLPWPCFPDHLSSLGMRYRAKGHHEKQRLLASPTDTRSISPRELPKSLQASAAMQLQRAMPQEHREQFFSVLSAHDRKYVQDLTSTVITNFSSPNFSLQDWYTINLIVRYMIIAKTPRCQLEPDRERDLRTAKRLCEQFSHDDETSVMVFDLSAEPYTERALYQNDYSRRVIGTVVQNPYYKGVDISELYNSMLVTGITYICRGSTVSVYAQRHWCTDGVVREIDMNFYVDPESFLMVVWGKLTRPRLRLFAPLVAAAPPLEADLLPCNWEKAFSS